MVLLKVASPISCYNDKSNFCHLSRMWVLQSQGLDYRKRPSNSKPKRRVKGSLQDFLSASGGNFDLKSKGDEDGGKSLGPQHAELLVRLHKLCSVEMATLIISKLCDLNEEQRVVFGEEVKACPDEKVAILVETLNSMEKEQMDFVLAAEGELASIVQEMEDNLVQERRMEEEMKAKLLQERKTENNEKLGFVKTG